VGDYVEDHVEGRPGPREEKGTKETAAEDKKEKEITTDRVTFNKYRGGLRPLFKRGLFYVVGFGGLQRAGTLI
jgi:hypothetical protein